MAKQTKTGDNKIKSKASKEFLKTATSKSSKADVPKISDKGKKRAAPVISDALKQAVKELGGDDEDLELIAGVDSDDDDASTSAVKAAGKSNNEKDLREELGSFMKGLNFAALAPTAATESDGEEEEVEDDEEVSEGSEDEEDEEDSGGDEEVAGEEEEDEEEDDDDSEEEESEQEEEIAVASKFAVAPASVQEAPKVAEKKKSEFAAADPQPTSGSVVPASPVWTELLPPLQPLSTPLPPLIPSKLNSLKTKATQLLETLPSLSRAGSSSDAAFISQILTSGTHQDKLSALVLLVRESPIHAVKELGRLRNMLGWKEGGDLSGGAGGNKDQRIAVMKALADWWVNGGGKEQGKLRYFADQPLLAHPDLTDRHLLVFAFEDFMKRWFFHVLQVLEVFSHDTLPFIRTQALHLIFQLLRGNAEQEQNLLRLGVNKLGDNDRSVASKASHHILQLLQVHPAMKVIVAREISALVLKPAAATSTTPAAAASGMHVRFDDEKSTKGKDRNIPGEVKHDATTHARYYGLITLNQIPLTNKDQEVAGKLVELYFEVFRELLGEGMKLEKKEAKKGGEKNEDGEGEEGIDADVVEKVAGKVDKWRGRKIGAKPKGGRKSALETEQSTETHDARLLAAVLTGVNRALPYAQLDEALFENYMTTLFRITHSGTFNISIQALQLIFQVCQSRQSISDRFYRTLYESIFDHRLITSSKQAMYLNLLFKAMKVDTSLSRVMAFVKRLLQMLGMHQPPFICGALYLLAELFSSVPGLKRMLIEPEDDEDEHFVDAPEDGSKRTVKAQSPKPTAKTYDGKKRDPQFAQADSSCLWDLLPLCDHFHPSVSLQATQLLLSQPISGSSDISLNTLVMFLDRFVYRNPKKQLQPKGASIMQPAASTNDMSGMVSKQKGARSGESGFVNSESFWRKKIEEVPVDQLFFHKFFSGKLAQKEAKKSTEKKQKMGMESSEDEDDEEEEGEVAPSEAESENEIEEEEAEGDAEGSDSEEDEIWKAMQASMPGAEDDMGLSDDSDMDDDDDDDDDDEDVEEENEDDDEEDDEEDDEDAESVDQDDDDNEVISDDGDSDMLDVEEDEDDLIPLDEMPNIALEAKPSDAEEDNVKAGKRKRNDERKERKKKRKEMPVFGSYEDYAALIEAAGNDGED